MVLNKYIVSMRDINGIISVVISLSTGVWETVLTRLCVALIL